MILQSQKNDIISTLTTILLDLFEIMDTNTRYND